jgi:DSHCT (NUC185) domain
VVLRFPRYARYDQSLVRRLHDPFSLANSFFYFHVPFVAEKNWLANAHPPTQITDQLFEGSLIRVFRRLGELLRQMAQAANVIGNSELKEKFEKALEMLERPNSVIFCSSLYL